MMAHIVMSKNATRIAYDRDESCRDRTYTCAHDCMDCCSLIVSAATTSKSQSIASAHETDADDHVVMTTILNSLRIMMVVIKINLPLKERLKLENIFTCLSQYEVHEEEELNDLYLNVDYITTSRNGIIEHHQTSTGGRTSMYVLSVCIQEPYTRKPRLYSVIIEEFRAFSCLSGHDPAAPDTV